MNYENPEKRLSLLNKEIFDPSSEIYLENLLDLATSVSYDIHSSGTWKNSKPMKSFLERYTNFSDKIYKSRVSVNDFECLKVIGQGGFGRVDLVKHKQTKNVYAMKVIEKTTYIQNAFNGFWEERDILAKNDSDWLVKCFYAFMDLKKLYIVMEYMPGGNLYHWLMELEEFDEKQTHFYALEMILAVETIHKMEFIHRDLKPDNMLLDKNGHLKLADFGTCIKTINGKVKTNFQVGTPDYIAPEVLRNAGIKDLEVGFEIDWWALGIVTFELFYGETPFEGECTSALYKNIMSFKNSLNYPDDKDASNEFLSFLKNIITESKERMDINLIKTHPFVISNKYGWNLENIREHKCPLMIAVSGEDDVKYITYDPVDKRDIASAFTNNNFFSGENLAFSGFTFNRSHIYNSQSTPTKSESVNAIPPSELQAKLAEIELSKQQLTMKLEKQFCEFTQIQGKLANAERDLAEKEQIISIKKCEQNQTLEANKQLKTKFELLSKQYETSQKEMQQLNAVMSEKESTIKKMKLEIANTSETIASLKNNLLDKEEKLAEINVEFEERCNQLDNLSKVESCLLEERNNVTTLSNELNLKNRKILEYEKQLEVLDHQITELSSVKIKLDTVKLNNNGKAEELEIVRAKYDQILREKQIAESKMSVLTDELKSIQTERDLLRSELRTEQLKRTALEKTREKMNKELMDKKSQFNILQNKAYESEDQIRILKQRVNGIEREKEEMELQCNMLQNMAVVKRNELEEAAVEYSEMKDFYEMKKFELENDKNILQQKFEVLSEEYNKVKVECNESKIKLNQVDSMTLERNQLMDLVSKLKAEISEKKQEIEKLFNNNNNLELESSRLKQQVIQNKVMIDELVKKIKTLFDNPDERLNTRNKKESTNRQTAKRVKQLELDVTKLKSNVEEKMQELSLVKNECQNWRDRVNELEAELVKKDNVITHLFEKIGDNVNNDLDLKEDVMKNNVLSTQLEGRIEVLKKGKGRHKIAWLPYFAILQPFKMDLYQNENDQVPQQTIDIKTIIHVRESTTADYVHIDKTILPQMLQIIYSKSDIEDSRRGSVLQPELGRRNKSNTFSTDDSNPSFRSSAQDISGISYIKNHSFVQMRFRSPQICDLCHESCSDFIYPPAALECSKCKQRIHADHVNDARILSCQEAMEVIAIKLESNVVKSAWIQRFNLLRKYQKSDEVHIGKNTYYRSVRHLNNHLSPNSSTLIP